MALREIRTEEDGVLYKTSKPVTAFNSHIGMIIDDMRDTLIDSGGVGLAAPQVGVLRRIVLVMDINKEDLTPEEQIVELVNPEIISAEGEQTGPEGCLSIPGKYGIVTRPETVTVSAYDRNGNKFEYTGEGYTARAFCHEIDHLDGHLYTEFVQRMLTDEEIEEMLSASEEE